jgi:hypothetical protein
MVTTVYLTTFFNALQLHSFTYHVGVLLLFVDQNTIMRGLCLVAIGSSLPCLSTCTGRAQTPPPCSSSLPFFVLYTSLLGARRNSPCSCRQGRDPGEIFSLATGLFWMDRRGSRICNIYVAILGSYATHLWSFYDVSLGCSVEFRYQ